MPAFVGGDLASRLSGIVTEKNHALYESMKRTYPGIDDSASKKLASIPKHLRAECLDETGAFSLEKYTRIAAFAPFETFPDDQVVKYASYLEMLTKWWLDRETYLLNPQEFATLGVPDLKPKHTTLVIGCGSDAKCLNHAQRLVSVYCIDVNPEVRPNCVIDMHDQKLWQAVQKKGGMSEIVVEGMDGWTNLKLVYTFFDGLKPGGILKFTHVYPRYFAKGDGTLSVDALVYPTLRLVDEGPLLTGLTFNEMLMHVGFSIVELVVDGSEKVKLYQSVPQLWAHKPGGKSRK